jgi:ectoine hydroxylase-related dioxygenase (phytanoyl-CoA dioxygenase family)
VLDEVIPFAALHALNDEVLSSTGAERPPALRGESIGFGRFRDDGGDGGLGSRAAFERWLRPGRATRGLRPAHDVVHLPLLTAHLAHPAVVAVARAALDAHVRIAQMHPRVLRASGFGGTPGTPESREWHTDWPHDLPGYAGGDGCSTAGAIRQPFPDVTMALTMVWLLDDVDEASGGGTWVVPGAHRDTRNPRGENDGVRNSAPIPGELQVRANAGAVLIIDSRMWHSTACYLPEARTTPRTAVVTRWCPWWLSCTEWGGPPTGFLSLEEFEALPPELQPFLRHVCVEVEDTLQPGVVERAEAALATLQRGFAGEPNPAANADVRVEIRPLHRM